MAMRPPTWPATVSCRTLSRIVTRCDTDNPDCITCDTSRRLRHSSCRDAEPDSSTPEKRYCGTFVAFLGGPQCPWGCTHLYRPAGKDARCCASRSNKLRPAASPTVGISSWHFVACHKCGVGGHWPYRPRPMETRRSVHARHRARLPEAW